MLPVVLERKGRERDWEWQGKKSSEFCRHWFSTFSVHPTILESMFWFHCAGNSRRPRTARHKALCMFRQHGSKPSSSQMGKNSPVAIHVGKARHLPVKYHMVTVVDTYLYTSFFQTNVSQ